MLTAIRKSVRLHLFGIRASEADEALKQLRRPDLSHGHVDPSWHAGRFTRLVENSHHISLAEIRAFDYHPVLGPDGHWMINPLAADGRLWRLEHLAGSDGGWHVTVVPGKMRSPLTAAGPSADLDWML